MDSVNQISEWKNNNGTRFLKLYVGVTRKIKGCFIIFIDYGCFFHSFESLFRVTILQTVGLIAQRGALFFSTTSGEVLVAGSLSRYYVKLPLFCKDSEVSKYNFVI